MVETMRYTRRSWDRGVAVYGRLPRLVEYLRFMGHEEQALEVTRGVREVIQGLMSPFGIDKENWLASPSPTGEPGLDLLLARLTWPSGMVRERVCESLAELLVIDSHHESVSSALLEWISSQGLESVACLGLLPFVRAQQLEPAVQIPGRDEFSKACRCPSLLFEILLAELCGEPAQALPLGTGYGGVLPRGFEPSSDFLEQYEHALPTVYRDRARTLSTEFAVPFLQRWGYEVAQTNRDLRNAHLPFDEYWGRPDIEHFVAFDCHLSETLRSGYLRALAWLSQQGEEQRFYAAVEALRTLPIDLGLWQVTPQPLPAWWPLRLSAAKEELDVVPAEVLAYVEELWTRQCQEDEILGMAQGCDRQV
jgi:hypothetical protein